MSAIVTPGTVTRAGALATIETAGCSAPRSWGNGPEEIYGWHAHERDKVLFCLDGSIVFQTDDGEAQLSAGDRLDLPAGTRHAATVWPDGCACVEAWGP